VRPRPLLILAVGVALAAGIILAAILVSNSSDEEARAPRAPAPTVTVGTPPEVPSEARVTGPDGEAQTVTVPDAAAERLEGELEAGQAELNAPLREENDTPATTRVPGPLAADEVPGCRTRFVGNSSSRGGVRPSLIFLHQTVSRERAWSSQDALTAMASRRSSGVSWHLLIGRSEGRCTYTVPMGLKAWTQGNANPYAVGIEVEAYGDEGAYVTGAGRDRLVNVVRHIAERYSIPLRRGAVSSSTCRPIRSGIVEHSDAGACGGGHIDVTLAPGDAAGQVAAWARAAGPSSSDKWKGYTASERRWITEYDRLKRAGQDVDRRRVLRRVMCQQRGRVWQAATQPNPDQWDKASRRARWNSLRARTSATC
jgi:hypothetical protein